jgi:hypothetical protein
MRARALFALPLLVAAAAYGSAPPHRVAWTRAALERLAVASADRTPERRELRAQQLDVFARELARVSAKAPLPPRQWTALLGSVAFGESGFDTAVVSGKCLAHQCDPKRVDGVIRFQSVGAFQQKLFAHVADKWHAAAAGDIPAQVEMADRQLRRSMTRCKPFAAFPQHVYRAYGGGSCSFPVHREAVKVGAYHRLLATPAPTTGSRS